MQDSDKGVKPKKPVDEVCPACAGKVTYRGFSKIECETEECVNWDGVRKTLPALKPLENLEFDVPFFFW